MQKVLQALELTSEQTSAIRKIHLESEPGLKKMLGNVESQRESLYQALRSGSKSDLELRDVHSAYLVAKTKYKEARFEELLQIRNLLSEKQRLEFTEYMRKHRKMREKRQNTP